MCIRIHFSVTEGQGEVPLLCRNASVALGLLSVKAVNNVSKQSLFEQYGDVFSGLGKSKERTVKLHKKTKPVAQPLRRAPFQLRDKVKEELDELLKLDIIEEVDG